MRPTKDLREVRTVAIVVIRLRNVEVVLPITPSRLTPSILAYKHNVVLGTFLGNIESRLIGYTPWSHTKDKTDIDTNDKPTTAWKEETVNRNTVCGVATMRLVMKASLRDLGERLNPYWAELGQNESSLASILALKCRAAVPPTLLSIPAA